MTQARQYRLAVVTSHPVQYQAPLLQKLAQHPEIDLTVYYGSDVSVRGGMDPDFGIPVKWDRPLLEGYRYHFLNSGSQPNATLSEQLLVFPALRAGKYDAVFIHGYASSLALFGYLAAWLGGIPVLLRAESELSNPSRRWMRMIKRVGLSSLLKGTAGYLYIGSRNRTFYRAYGANEARFYFTPYCVDNEFFLCAGAEFRSQKAQLKAEYGFDADAPLIVFSGKLIQRKRPLDLLEAYARLVADGSKAGLLFVGEGELRATIEETVAAQGLTRVKISGFQNQTQLPRLYATGDIFVLPSELDPWGLVVNEAMLYSMPAIVSDRVGAGDDLVLPGQTGFVFPLGDVSKLTEYLKTLATNDELRVKLGTAAHERVLNWNYTVCVLEIVRALHEVSRRVR